MNCEEAINLISARIDGQLPPGDNATLDAHLAECEACRITIAELELQDAALMRAFVPGQHAAIDLANRVSQIIADQSAKSMRAPNRTKWTILARYVGWSLAAGIIGFAMGILFVQPRNSPSVTVTLSEPIPPSQTAARLTFATGGVFVCPSDQKSWATLETKDPIAVGTAIKTDNSKCELQMADGCCIRLNAHSEAKFISDRAVSLSAGQLWSAIPSNAPALRVSAGKTSVTAEGGVTGNGTQFETACIADGAIVSVSCGMAEVGTKGTTTPVHAGEILRPPLSAAAMVCTAIPDALQATQWQDDLITMRPADDPAIQSRLEQILTRIAASDKTDPPCPTEADLRAGGESWCSPLAYYLHKNLDGPARLRHTAARLLADLAPSANIPELIALLDDPDGDVRSLTAIALRRLTGQTLGFSPELLSSTNDPNAKIMWTSWWNDVSRWRYSPQKSAPAHGR